MISSLLLATAIGQSGFSREFSEKHVLLVLCRSEDAIDLSNLKSLTPTSAELKESTGIVTHKFEVDNYVVLISEQVAPIDAYAETSRFMADVDKSGSTSFEHASEAGKFFQDTFNSILPRKSTAADPKEKCFGIALQVQFNSVQSPLKTPVTVPRGMDMSKIAKPLLDGYSPTEVSSPEFKRPKSKLSAFSSFTKRTMVVKPIDPTQNNQMHSVQSLNAVSKALSEASEEITKLYLEYRQSYTVLLSRLIKQFAGDLDNLPKEGAPFNELPAEFQLILKQHIMDYPGSYGFDSAESAGVFLQSNPVMKVKFSLSMFEGFSTLDPVTNKPNPGGGFVILRDPLDPDNP